MGPGAQGAEGSNGAEGPGQAPLFWRFKAITFPSLIQTGESASLNLQTLLFYIFSDEQLWASTG